ncbi:MAG TPA: aminoacyl-tRNA hydrolase [Rhodospirillaceae bacterium]|nr:aminoacyl-tRNA hydrolase [Rhodospirillaceae bacterium]
MRLLVGLGNPGAAYMRNRHNIGAMAADEIVRRHRFSPWRAKFQGLYSEGLLAGQKLVLLKPETFMNLSGQSVAAACRYLQIEPADLVVLHDDLDLAPGKVRIKQGGGAGGHNGLRSIDAHFGNDYWRIRLGIGHPGHKDLVTPWVLGNFAKSDAQWLDPLLEALAENMAHFLAGDAPLFLTRLAQAGPVDLSKTQDYSGDS